MSDIESLSARALADIEAVQDPEALDALRVALLGKQGSITAQLKQLGALPPEQRKAAGEAINRARDALGDALAARKAVLDEASAKLKAIDQPDAPAAAPAPKAPGRRRKKPEAAGGDGA